MSNEPLIIPGPEIEGQWSPSQHVRFVVRSILEARGKSIQDLPALVRAYAEKEEVPDHPKLDYARQARVRDMGKYDLILMAEFDNFLEVMDIERPDSINSEKMLYQTLALVEIGNKWQLRRAI